MFLKIPLWSVICYDVFALQVAGINDDSRAKSSMRQKDQRDGPNYFVAIPITNQKVSATVPTSS